MGNKFEPFDDEKLEHVDHLMIYDWGESWHEEDEPLEKRLWSQRIEDRWNRQMNYLKAQDDLEAIGE